MEWANLFSEWRLAVPFFAGLAAHPTKNALTSVYNRLMHDIPHIEGTYESKYQFKDEGGVLVDAEEIIQVRRYGRWIRAEAQMTKPIKKKWKIKGEVRGAYVFATVESATKKTLSGRGCVLMASQINGDKLSGQMTWVDSGLQKIWATEYVWIRTDKDVTN